MAILSYFKLKTLISRVSTNDYCDYLGLVDKSGVSDKKLYLVEPQNITDIPKIKETLNSTDLAIFKTITSFKGLERDIIFLLVPSIEGFKAKYPNRIENFLMQVYVGASRAKFRLYFIEYDIN